MSSNEPLSVVAPGAADYEGKAKRVRRRGDGRVEIFFKDDATAGNGKKRASFPGKGVLCSQISEIFFRYLAARGVATHLIERLDERTFLCRAVSIVPLEVVVRFRAAGSLVQRVGLEKNSVCEPPIVEFYYKRDDLGDPLINDDHVRILKLATPAELLLMREAGMQIATELADLLLRANIALYDLKLEFGRTDKGLLLADEISPDTCRFRDVNTLQVLDKDVFRQDLAELVPTYQEVLARLQRVTK